MEKDQKNQSEDDEQSFVDAPETGVKEEKKQRQADSAANEDDDPEEEGIDPTKTEEDEMMSDGCDDDDVIGTDGQSKKKQKRRSKNDVDGRDYKCTFCDKTYLSYPALYTHMKNKHAKGPDGQPLIAFNSGRGRGRPKKNTFGSSRNAVEPTSREFFRTSDKVGGPIEPTVSFNDIYTEIFIKKKAKPTPRADENTTNQENDKSDCQPEKEATE